MQMIMFVVESTDKGTHITRTRAANGIGGRLAEAFAADDLRMIDRPIGAARIEVSSYSTSETITTINRIEAASSRRKRVAAELAEQDAERWDGLY